MQRFLTILFLFSSIVIYGQKSRNKKTPPLPNLSETGCIKKYDYPLSQRVKNYPFHIADKIMVVSFNIQRDSLNLLQEGKLPQEDDRLKIQEIPEIIPLNKNQIDSLTDILYNYDYESNVGTITHNCFNPRHAIVFLDNSDKVIGYIEICFECSGNQTSDEKIKTGNFCGGKYDLLQDFFKHIGIERGFVIE